MVTGRCHGSWLRDYRRCPICSSRVSEVMQSQVLELRVFPARSKAVRILFIGRPPRVKTRLEMFMTRFCSCRSPPTPPLGFRHWNIASRLFFYITSGQSDKSSFFIMNDHVKSITLFNCMAVSKRLISTRCAVVSYFSRDPDTRLLTQCVHAFGSLRN
jgi:hypothetical protein